MKLLFFDMEFADGRVPGSIYSLGYLMTDGEFRILEPQTDLLINPNSTWNEYVEANILAYPKEEVEAAPEFCDLFPTIKALFERADLAVGFSTSNDTRAMRKACERYGIEPFSFRCFDTEKLCRNIFFEHYKQQQEKEMALLREALHNSERKRKELCTRIWEEEKTQ